MFIKEPSIGSKHTCSSMTDFNTNLGPLNEFPNHTRVQNKNSTKFSQKLLSLRSLLEFFSEFINKFKYPFKNRLPKPVQKMNCRNMQKVCIQETYQDLLEKFTKIPGSSSCPKYYP